MAMTAAEIKSGMYEYRAKVNRAEERRKKLIVCGYVTEKQNRTVKQRKRGMA